MAVVKFELKAQILSHVRHLNFMKNILNKKNKKGFTLIEVVIAVGLFSVVMMVALAIILSVVDNNKKVHSVNVVVDNLNFAIDSMVRDIKTGKHYGCRGDGVLVIDSADYCAGTDHKSITLISTLSDQNKIVQYRYDNTPPGKILKSYCILDSATNTCVSGTRVDGELTSPEINITDVTFIVNPGTQGIVQPTVFLLIKGTSAINPTDASNFSIQTLISQRYLNI